jgi:hypothetical protein
VVGGKNFNVIKMYGTTITIYFKKMRKPSREAER